MTGRPAQVRCRHCHGLRGVECLGGDDCRDNQELRADGVDPADYRNRAPQPQD